MAIGGLGGLGGYRPPTPGTYQGVRTQDELRLQMENARRGAQAARKAAMGAVTTPDQYYQNFGASVADSIVGGNTAMHPNALKGLTDYFAGRAEGAGGFAASTPGYNPNGSLGGLMGQAEANGYTGPDLRDISRYGMNPNDRFQAQLQDIDPARRPLTRYSDDPWLDQGIGNYTDMRTAAGNDAVSAYYEKSGALTPEQFDQQAKEAADARQRVNEGYQTMQGNSYFGGMLTGAYGMPDGGWSGDPMAGDPNNGSSFGAWRPARSFTAGKVNDQGWGWGGGW